MVGPRRWEKGVKGHPASSPWLTVVAYWRAVFTCSIKTSRAKYVLGMREALGLTQVLPLTGSK